MNESRSLVLFLFCFPRVDIKNGRGPPLRIQPPLPEDSEQSPMSASVIRQAHGGCTDQAFSVWAEWGTWVFDFGFRSTIHKFTAIKKKTNSNTVYSKQYLKSIGLRISSIYYYTFFSLVPGEGRPTFTHTQKLLTIWAQCICLSRNDWASYHLCHLCLPWTHGCESGLLPVRAPVCPSVSWYRMP